MPYLNKVKHELGEAKDQCNVLTLSLSKSNEKIEALLGEIEKLKVENLSIIEKSNSLEIEKSKLLVKLKLSDEKRLLNDNGNQEGGELVPFKFL